MPKPEPFGYFRVEPFIGWTDCSEADDGAMALYDQAAVDALERERDELKALLKESVDLIEVFTPQEADTVRKVRVAIAKGEKP